MPHLSVNQQTSSVNKDCPLPIADTYANAILRTLSSFKPPSPPISLYTCQQHRRSYPHIKTVSQSVVNELVNGSSDNQQSLADPSSLSSSSSSLFSSSSYSSNNHSGNCFTLEAHLPLVKNNIEQLAKFKRLLSRLDTVYNNKNSNMTTTALPPSTTSHIPDRYLFRSLSNDNQTSRIPSATARKNKVNPNNPASSTTPPELKKRYKFSSNTPDQNNNNVYKFPNGQTEQRAHSTDANRYYFPPEDSTKKPQQTLTYVRSGTGLEQRAVTFINGTSATTDKISSPTTKSIQPTTITPDTPYLFSKAAESQRHPSATSSVNPEDAWIQQRQQPHIIFDSITDSSPSSQLKRPRTTSTSPEHRQLAKRSPTRVDTVTSTNGSLSTLRRSPPNKVQNVRFDPSSTPRSYLTEARERLAGKKRGRSPQAFQQSIDRLVSSTNQKYLQQQIVSPSFQQHQHDYVSQYYAQEEEPPIDYPMDDDDDEQHKRSFLYNRNLNTNRTHGLIMKNVNRSLIDRSYLPDANRLKQLDQNVHRYLRYIENQSLQRELNHDLIRCFSSTYLDDLRREENRHFQTRMNSRAYTYEDIQDIHMSQVLEAYKMKRAIDRERRFRLSTSFDGPMTSSTPTSSIGAGHLSPLLSSYSPIMTGSLNENMDAQSGGFETDRRSQKSHTSTSQTPTSLRPGYIPPGPGLDLFYEIMQDSFRGVDASIAGQVSHASQYTKHKGRHQLTTTSQIKPVDQDSDVDIKSTSSFWSDEEEEQMVVDHQRKPVPHQKQLSRYLSTVNRSLLDRPSDLIADFYISQLNRNMQESVRHVETISRDKALMRQTRNREFIDETTSKLGRSLSAEHLYQVRKEHLRYKQTPTKPTSFTVEDVEDIYKPFVLENYKRKIAIELERRRRERQGQLMAGIGSPPMYASDTDFTHVIKATQPAIIELPLVDRQQRPSNLTRTRILRTNETGTQSYDNDLIIVRPPVVQTKEIVMGHARRTLTDDGSADVVHHIGIVSPPPSYSIVKRPSAQTRPTTTTSTTDQHQIRRISTVSPPDFPIRSQVYTRQERIPSSVVQILPDELVDGALSTSQQVLIKDEDYDPSLRRPVQIITTIQSTTASRRPPAKIYTPVPPSETVRICQADLVETESGNYDLSMVNIRPVVTLNQGEIKELNLLAQQAQRLQIPPRDYDHAMIILTPEQTQYQHNINQQPLLLATANIDQLHDDHHEEVTRHIEQEIHRQRTQLITPVPEHMAKVEQDIPVFENISSTNITQPSQSKLNEVPYDSGIVSLNTSQASEQPVILNASRIHRLEHSDEPHVENLREDEYYRRRVHALDFLRQVDRDPNTNIQPVRSNQYEIFENTTDIPSSHIPPEHTQMIDDYRINHIQTLEHTDHPVIYDSIDQEFIQRIPQKEQLNSSDVYQDNQTSNRAEQNQLKWGLSPAKQYHSTQNQLPEAVYDQTQSFVYDQRESLRPLEETTPHLETTQQPIKSIIYNYGQKNDIPVSRTSSFGSDKDLKQQALNSARVDYDHRTLSALDEVTQPVSHHPPVQTHHIQQHTVTDIDAEPMAVREEMALENEVSYDGSFGRASFSGPIQPLNAPKTLAQPSIRASLLEELDTATTAVHKQQATQLIETDYPQKLLKKLEPINRVSMIVYDTDWKDEKVKPISSEVRSGVQNAEHKYPSNIGYEQAQINFPKSILARERYELIEHTNQETTQQIDTTSIQRDRSIEGIESENKLYKDQRSIDNQRILCRPIDNHIQMADERTSSLTDDSFLIRNQQQPNVKFNEETVLEDPVSSTSFITLKYSYHDQEVNPQWQQVSNQQVSDQQQQQYLQYITEQISPRYLIQESDNYASEFHQVPLLHENVRIQSTESINLVPSTQISQSRPVCRVRQQQISSNNEYVSLPLSTVHPDHVDRIDTVQTISPPINRIYIKPQPPVTVDIEVRLRPTLSETSSLVDMDSVLNRYEDNFEHELQLPLVDQVSVTYSTSPRFIHDNTHLAIERYEREHPFFSRALPLEWLTPAQFPHEEQLVEQWMIEKNLETIQQQVELRTNTECATVVAAAIANDAYSIGERFEEEESNSLSTKNTTNEQQNNQIVSAIIASHCSPTSDYETDSLDKDNDTTSTTTSLDAVLTVTTTPRTTTLPSQSSDTVPAVPVDYLLNTLANEPKDKNNITKDFLLTLGFGQREIKIEENIHCAKENELESDDNLLSYNFDEYQQELLNIFFEPTHFFHLPTINEILVYQLSINNEYSNFFPSNFLLPRIHTDDLVSSNDYKTNQQEILSIAQINHQSDNEEDLESISYKYEQPSFIEHYHIQSLHTLSETLYVHIDEPPKIMENEDDQSASSILPDLIPSTTTIQNEEFIHYEPREVTILPANPPIESTPLYPFNRTEKARQSTESYNFERLPEHNYVEINIATPTPSMRKVRPSRIGTYTEDLIMENTVDVKREQARSRYTDEDNLHYATATSREQSDHLPPKHLPVEHMPDLERAHLVPSSAVPLPNLNKNDEILVRDTIVQHISEDEKSTSSEEVVFEEWSEEFRCRRTDEIERSTNRLLRTTIDETSQRVKSDVIKEEYKEKNERIKGHKSYDVVKEVYRRVPAHTIDITQTNVVSIDRPQSHVYEEIPHPPPSTIPRSLSSDRQYTIDTPRERHWSSEDIYTTEIVYDSQLARDIEAATHRTERLDTSTPPPIRTNYDRVRPGQYPPMPSTAEVIISTVPSSNYDRISNIKTPSTHFADHRQQEQREDVVSEEYKVEFEKRHADRHSPPNQRQAAFIDTKHQRDETSEEDVSDPYVTTGDGSYHGLSSIINEAGQRRDSDWRNKLKQVYAPTSDDDRFDQFGKQTNGNYTAQRVSVVPTSVQQRFKEVQIKIPTRDKTPPQQSKLKTSPPLRHAVKEILVCVSRGSSLEKQLHQPIDYLHSSSDDDEKENKRFVLVDSGRSRETTRKNISTSHTDDDRPQPPKRSSSSSSIIDERRTRFEQQFDTTNNAAINRADRPTFSRVGELKSAFESSPTGSTKDDLSKYKSPISTGLTEQRRRIFEEQEQTNKEWIPTNRRPQQVTRTTVVPQRRVHRISGRQRTSLIDDYHSNERRISETHTAPSRVTERISHIENTDPKSVTRVQSTDRLGRTGFDAIKSSLESSMTKTTEPFRTPQTSVDITIKDKRIISSMDSDISGASPPIYQSTPKSTKQKHDEDAGHESEDELSDPTNQQNQYYDTRRRTSKTRLRDFSQSTSQPIDSTYLSQRTKSSFNETNMENFLSHVPTSKGKALLIELSPHTSHEPPITSTTIKPTRDPLKSTTGSDSGIFDYSTGTSQHLPTTSSSWRNNVSTSINDDLNRTSTTRDGGIYVDSAATTANSRYGRRQASDTDQTTIHGGDDSISRSTFKYDTEIISNDQLNQQQQRNIRRQITSSPPSDYETIANYHSGISSQRKVPITTQSRTVMTKPLVVDEIETIETETRVECQVQRTHEIKESTTKTESTGSPHTPKKIITTTTTTTTTTAPTVRSPEYSSDEVARTTTPSKRVLLNERTQYYDPTKPNGSPITTRSPLESAYTPTHEIRQHTQTYRESGIHQHRFDSPQSDSISYPATATVTATFTQQEEPIRVEETWFKPIQRDRSQDSLLQSSSTRSNVRTLSAGPRNVEVTSLSPQNQVTFGKYTPNEIIAIVRVPELSHNVGVRPSPQPPTITSTIRHGSSEPELYTRARQEEEQQRAKLHYQRVHAASYLPPPITQDYQQRQSRSRTGPYDTTNEYSSSLGAHARSSSYHAALHEQDRQQQQEQNSYSPTSGSANRRQYQRRSGSLGNLFGPNIEFEIEIEKRPPQQPEQPTVVGLDQATRAIVTTSKDGRVSIQNVAARPGNTVTINSDFHSSDRSLNRSSGYFSSDELRSQGLNPNYSSDEQSSAAGMNPNQNSQSSHTRRYKINDQSTSKLPSHYRPRQQNTYQHLNNDSFDKINQIVHRYNRQSNNTTGFNEAIDQIDALYNNLDVQTNEDYIDDRFLAQQGNNHLSTYDFSRPTSTTNRRKHLSQNTNEYSKRYSSTGFQQVPSPYEQETTTTNSTVRHLVSPTITSNNDKRRHDTHRAFSDNENLNNVNEHNRNWGSTSLNDLVMATPVRPSQSLSSSGILADYGTPGSISPNSGFGSTQNVILQQNRSNGQAQIVQRNRTSVKQVKQKSAAKKKMGNIQGQYSDEEDDNDSAGGHDSPLSDNGRPQPPTRSSNRHQ